jgi:hypothetical protein
MAASMITQAGFRSSSISRSMRRSMAGASLNGTGIVRSAATFGIPSPYWSDS